MFSHGYAWQIQRPISENSILVPFMYAYCSNYPCRTCLPFQCAFIHKQTYYLVRGCLFAFNFQYNVFICLSSIVSLCLVLTLSLYYCSSFLLRFFKNFTSCNKWENAHSALNSLKYTSVDWNSHNIWCLVKMFHFVPFSLLSLC